MRYTTDIYQPMHIEFTATNVNRISSRELLVDTVKYKNKKTVKNV